VEQEPWDRIWNGRWTGGYRLSLDLAAVAILPDGAGEVGPDLVSLVVEEGRLGRLEDPLRVVIDLLAGVDLNAFGSEAEQEALALGLRGGALLLGVGDGRKREGSGEEDGEASHGVEQFT